MSIISERQARSHTAAVHNWPLADFSAAPRNAHVLSRHRLRKSGHQKTSVISPKRTILYFSHSARILMIKSKSDLDPKHFSVIVVSYLLNDQERQYEYGYSAAATKAMRARLAYRCSGSRTRSSAGTADVSDQD